MRSARVATCSGEFAPWAAVAEQVPVRAFGKDVSRVAAFVLAVVPFDQVTINLGYGSEPSELARPHAATQGLVSTFANVIPFSR